MSQDTAVDRLRDVALGFLRTLAIVIAGLGLIPPVPAQQADRGTAALPILPGTDRAPLPEFAVTAADGRRVGLADFGDQVVLLNFWATWCEPCRAEMPSLERLAAELADAPFAVLAISVDRTGKPVVDRFYDELALEHLDRYFDPRRKAADAVAVAGLPTSILVDRKGREISRLHGALDWNQPSIKTIIEQVLNEVAR